MEVMLLSVLYILVYPAYSTASTVYSTSNGEVSSSGTSYTAGGNALTNNGIAGTTTAFGDFADLTFPSVTLTAAGAAIYKSTGGGNELVLVLDFGGNKTATNGDFVIQFPTADASNAIIRLRRRLIVKDLINGFCT